MAVSPASPAASGHNRRFIVRNVGNQSSALNILYEGSSGDTDYKVGAVFAETAVSAAGLSVFGRIFSFITEISQS